MGIVSVMFKLIRMLRKIPLLSRLFFLLHLLRQHRILLGLNFNAIWKQYFTLLPYLPIFMDTFVLFFLKSPHTFLFLSQMLSCCTVS